MELHREEMPLRRNSHHPYVLGAKKLQESLSEYCQHSLCSTSP